MLKNIRLFIRVDQITTSGGSNKKIDKEKVAEKRSLFSLCIKGQKSSVANYFFVISSKKRIKILS